MPVGSSGVANYANTSSGSVERVYAPSSVGGSGVVNGFSGFPTDGSPTLVLDFTVYSGESLDLDFTNGAYQIMTLNAGQPTPQVGSYQIWE